MRGIEHVTWIVNWIWNSKTYKNIILIVTYKCSQPNQLFIRPIRWCSNHSFCTYFILRLWVCVPSYISPPVVFIPRKRAKKYKNTTNLSNRKQLDVTHTPYAVCHVYQNQFNFSLVLVYVVRVFPALRFFFSRFARYSSSFSFSSLINIIIFVLLSCANSFVLSQLELLHYLHIFMIYILYSRVPVPVQIFWRQCDLLSSAI